MSHDTQTPQPPHEPDSEHGHEENDATGEGMPQSPEEIDEDEAQ